LRKIRLVISIIFLCLCQLGITQSKFSQSKDVSKKIHFKLVGNLIIIPLEINDVSLSFVLDTGVNKAILFNLTETDSLQVNKTRTIYLQGLGSDGRVEALQSRQNTFKLGGALGTNMDLYILLDNAIDFAPRLGLPVHGIIGFDVFKDFVVEVNYQSRFIRLHKPETFTPKTTKKWQTLPIEIIKNKPFINANVTVKNKDEAVKLLVDTGSSDALWLFEDRSRNIQPDTTLTFYDFLGKGLSGSVYGQRSKVNKFNISDFTLQDVNVAFPDSLALDVTRVIKGRNGSLGGNILKRFNYFFDYTNEKMYLKKNIFFSEPFTYNNSGIIVEFSGLQLIKEAVKISALERHGRGSNYNSVQLDRVTNYAIAAKPVYIIADVRESSNAYAAGVRVGDILVFLNGKSAHNYELPEITRLLHGKTGKTIKLKIKRNNVKYAFKFKLDNAFKKNEFSN